MRLTGEIRDEANLYYGDSILYDVSGVPVYLCRGGEACDTASTDYGIYDFGCLDAGAYVVKSWVVASMPESIGPVSWDPEHGTDLDTLSLSGRGTIFAYPNPFRPSDGGFMTIRFPLEETSLTRLSVRAPDCRDVKVFEEVSRPAGTHTLAWDGRDDQGVILTPGPYWIVLSAGDEYRYTLALVAEPALGMN